MLLYSIAASSVSGIIVFALICVYVAPVAPQSNLYKYHLRLFKIFYFVDWLQYSFLYKVYNDALPAKIQSKALKINETRCSLCWEALSGTNTVVIGCGHKYHAHCLRKWEHAQYAKTNAVDGYKCPLDREPYSWTSKWKI